MAEVNGELDLVRTPVVRDIGGCNRGWVGYVSGVQDEYVPDSNISSDFMHCLVIRDIRGKHQAHSTATICLYQIFRLGERGSSPTNQYEPFGAGGRESYSGLAPNTTSLEFNDFISSCLNV